MIIDFHSHILPGADHGSDSVTTTEKQLALITAAGTGALVATPHFYPHRHRLSYFLSRRAAALADLLAIDAPKPRIYPGAEVLVCAGMEEMEGLIHQMQQFMHSRKGCKKRESPVIFMITVFFSSLFSLLYLGWS